ncbi:disulfide bond formation protein DsbA [Malaciobacter mytili]|uniref:DsbA family protein n=1 Tax=Malaciobacter mytili TaxID=603050 RepID=UPI00100C1C28|nr:thioredoxin domain-containing protein [Malaciobacter mytili]RXI37500.1 disulfide bond formation protein DsbA [Malaciobacter mytili]
MSFISKTLLASTLLISSIYANNIDEKVLNFEKDRFSKNDRVKVEKLSINLKKKLPLENWYGYIIDVEAKIADKSIKAKDVLFSNGTFIAPELLDINTGKSLKDIMTPTLTSKYYDKKRLIAGNENAKDKIVIFSDPLCPFCIDYVPEVIKFVKEHKNKIALYYYHFPLLRIHPAAETITKAMVIAKNKGVKDIELKVYQADFEPFFDSKETSKEKILEAFNKLIKTDIKLEELEDKKLQEEIFEDVAMGEEVMVQGTPTIFINGEQDKSKLKYEELGK